MPPPLRCLLAPAAEMPAVVDTRNQTPLDDHEPSLASPTPLQLASPTADLSAQMKAAALGFGVDHTHAARARAHSSSNKENSNYSGVFSFDVNETKGKQAAGPLVQERQSNVTDATQIDSPPSQPHVDVAIATANNINHNNSSIATRAPLQALDTRTSHWRSASLSASSPSTAGSSGLGLSFGLGSSGTLLTNNSNLSNSFRKGNGKRCLTRTPLQDVAGNAVADYPHAAEPTASATGTTTGMRLNMTAGAFPHDQLAAAEPSMQKADGPLSARADEGSSLQLRPLPSAALFSAPVAPLLPPAISFSTSTSSLSSPSNGAAASLRAPRFHDSPEEVGAVGGAGGMSVDHEPDHDFAPLESLPRTPTPCSSPARQQLQFDSGDKSAPSSASSSSLGFRGVGMAASSSALNGSGMRGSSGLRAPLSPLPSLDSPVIVRKLSRNSGGAGQGSHLGLSGLRGSTPGSGCGGLSARQQAMLASPALTIEVSSEPTQSRFQIRSLAGLVGPAPTGARGPHGLSAAAAAGPAMSTHEQESRREEEEMAQNRLSAAAAAAAVAAAVAATTESMGADPAAASAHSIAAQVERHRPKRARSIAASLFSSVAVELPLSRSGSMSACGPSSASASCGFADGSASTGVSPLLQSSSLMSLPPQHHPHGLQSHSYSASSHSSLSQALAQSGRRSTPLLSRTISSPLLFTHSEVGSGSDSPSDSSTPHSELGASASVSGALSPTEQMMGHHSSAAYAQQLLLSTTLAAEDSLLRTMAEVGSGFRGHSHSAATSSMLPPRSSASASPRCGGGASASPTPSPLDEEAFSGSWGLTPMAGLSSPLGSEGVTLMEFIPTLRIDEQANGAAPAAVTSAPLHMEDSSCAAADLALGHRPHQHLRRHHAHAASVVPCSSALSLHRRGSTSMIDTALINAHTPLVGLSSFAQGSGQAQAQAAAAATAAVLMDESEDDAAECASTLPRALIGGGGCASVSTGAAGSSGVLPGISGGPCDVKRISAATMVRLLAGDFQGELDNFIVIDCRYDYEYTGGHIDGAINLNDRALLSKFFRVNSSLGSRLAVVFHCEFSQNRAPKSYRFFRELDRIRNASVYPSLSFPEIAVLDGGYKAFYHAHPERCTPCSYVSMWDEAFQRECKEQTSIHRKSWGTGKVAAAHAHGHGHGAGAAAGAGAGAAASRALRRRSNTHGGLGLPGSSMALLRAASAVEPCAVAAAASSSPCGSSDAAVPVHGRGSSMFSPALSARSTSSAACVGSPLPSFSLLSAAASPADATAADVAAQSACSSSASTPAAAHGPSAHVRSVGHFSPLAFDINISSPERNEHGQEQGLGLGLGHAQGHRSGSM